MTRRIAVLAASLVLAACGGTVVTSTTVLTTATTPSAVVTTSVATATSTTTPGVEACQVPHQAGRDDVRSGFPRNRDRIPTTGTVTGIVLFADFDEAPAGTTPESVFAMISPEAEEMFSVMSYGRMDLVLEPHFEWLRMSQDPAFYSGAIRTFEGHRDWLREAVALADDAVDFIGADLVILIANPDAFEIAYGPTFTGFPGPAGTITADRVAIPNGVTSGADLTFWGFKWLNHEMGHSMGLSDLYSYEETAGFTRPFSLMDYIDSEAPEFLAWERWQLGWIDDDQVVCSEDSGAEAFLTAVEIPGGTKALAVPLGPTRVLVVESRRAIGYDAGLTTPGAVVYVVDSSVESGYGPIVVVGEPLEEGESLTVEGITITVTSATPDGDLVAVTSEG